MVWKTNITYCGWWLGPGPDYQTRIYIMQWLWVWIGPKCRYLQWFAYSILSQTLDCQRISLRKYLKFAIVATLTTATRLGSVKCVPILIPWKHFKDDVPLYVCARYRSHLFTRMSFIYGTLAQLWKLTTRFDFKENFRVLTLNENSRLAYLIGIPRWLLLDESVMFPKFHNNFRVFKWIQLKTGRRFHVITVV